MSKGHHLALGGCCCCVPLASGVLAYVVFVLLLSLCAAATGLIEDTRLLAGGYAYRTHTIVALNGCLGTVCCLGALAGVGDSARQRVRAFAHYAFVRVLVLAVVLGLDWEALRGCESLTLSGNRFTSISSQHYNAALQTVASQDACHLTRVRYLAITLADLALSAYGALATYRWCGGAHSPPAASLAILGGAGPAHYYVDDLHNGASP